MELDHQKEIITLKSKLLDLLLQKLRDAYSKQEALLKDLQVSANEETKSSVGDKYETGRAMVQLEIEKVHDQLANTKKMLDAVTSIEPKATQTVRLGTLVFTSDGNFYISTSGGTFTVDATVITTISPSSPLAQALSGKQRGDTVVMNGRKFTIEVIC